MLAALSHPSHLLFVGSRGFARLPPTRISNGNGYVIEFFQKVRSAYASIEIIHMVLDGASYHRSKEVVEAAGKLKIKLHYLPPYSPNLNPIERLWKVMNEYARNNEYFATAKEFRQKINHFFDETLPEMGASLIGRINDNFEMLQPAS